jgi:hypothetical protein
MRGWKGKQHRQKFLLLQETEKWRSRVCISQQLQRWTAIYYIGQTKVGGPWANSVIVETRHLVANSKNVFLLCKICLYFLLYLWNTSVSIQKTEKHLFANSEDIAANKGCKVVQVQEHSGYGRLEGSTGLQCRGRFNEAHHLDVTHWMI